MLKENKMSYKEFMNSQDAMRDKLGDIMISKKMSVPNIAREIGISTGTLVRFIKKEKKLTFRVVCKINEYIQRSLHGMS